VWLFLQLLGRTFNYQLHCAMYRSTPLCKISKKKFFLKMVLRITPIMFDCFIVKTTLCSNLQISSLASFKNLEGCLLGMCFLVCFKPHFYFCFKGNTWLCCFKGFLCTLTVTALNAPLKNTKQQSCCCHCCLIFLGGQPHTSLLLSPECSIL